MLATNFDWLRLDACDDIGICRFTLLGLRHTRESRQLIEKITSMRKKGPKTSWQGLGVCISSVALSPQQLSVAAKVIEEQGLHLVPGAYSPMTALHVTTSLEDPPLNILCVGSLVSRGRCSREIAQLRQVVAVGRRSEKPFDFCSGMVVSLLAATVVTAILLCKCLCR